MSRRETVRHEFVETIPDHLQEGMIYISVPYATALHRCLCGCGSEIVTPLSPTDWELTFNVQSISLSPSIGNWSYECQSHYWIRRNRVHWSHRMSARQIERVREKDRLEKEGFSGDDFDDTDEPTVETDPQIAETANVVGPLRRFVRRFPRWLN
jgi:hypothetical protein